MTPTEYDTVEYKESLRRALDALAPFSIDLKRLQFDECPPLGRGGYAIVKRGKLRPIQHLGDGQPDMDVAVKELLPNEHKPLRLALRLAREMKIWSELDHPNILKFLGFHLNLDQSRACLVSPFCSNGSLRARLGDLDISTDVRDGWVMDVAEGLRYLHALNPPVVHGDLKAENVLLSAGNKAVLCDFGLSKMIDQTLASGLTTSRSVKGSLRWFSPELLDGGARSTGSDVWAFGLTALEILTSQIPYPAQKTEAAIIRCIVWHQIPSPADHRTLVSDSRYWAILRECWVAQLSHRISMEECYGMLVADAPKPTVAPTSWKGSILCSLDPKVLGFEIYVQASKGNQWANSNFTHWPPRLDVSVQNLRLFDVDGFGSKVKSSGVPLFLFKPNVAPRIDDEDYERNEILYESFCDSLSNKNAGAAIYFSGRSCPPGCGLFLFPTRKTGTSQSLLGALFLTQPIPPMDPPPIDDEASYRPPAQRRPDALYRPPSIPFMKGLKKSTPKVGARETSDASSSYLDWPDVRPPSKVSSAAPRKLSLDIEIAEPFRRLETGRDPNYCPSP